MVDYPKHVLRVQKRKLQSMQEDLYSVYGEGEIAEDLLNNLRVKILQIETALRLLNEHNTN